jgi:hypothetical protein
MNPRRGSSAAAWTTAHDQGLFTGPTWTVLLTTGTQPGATLQPFIVRARDPQLAQVIAASVLRSEGLHVLGVVPGDHQPVPGSRLLPAGQLAATHPAQYAAARAVLDAQIAALGKPHPDHPNQPPAATDHPGPGLRPRAHPSTARRL